jgi:RNA-binding protein
VILKLEESTGSIVVDQIGRSVILYRPSSSKMKKRQEVAKSPRRFVKSEETSEEQPRSSTSKRYFKSGSTFRAQQKRRPMPSKGYSYSRG